MRFMLLFAFLIQMLDIFGQESFQIQFDNANFYIADASIGSDDKVALLGHLADTRETMIVTDYLVDQPGQTWFGINKGTLTWSPVSLSVAKLDWSNPNMLIAQTRLGGNCPLSISGLNMANGDYWEFCTGNSQFSAMAVDNALNTYLFVGSSVPFLYKINAEGEVIERLYIDGFSFDASYPRFMDAVCSAEQQRIAVAGHASDSSSFVLSIDTSGQVLKSQMFEEILLDNVLPDSQGGFWVSGSTTLYSNQSGNVSDMVLFHLDEMLNTIAVQVFYADEFDYTRSNMALLPDGSLALAYSTRGAYPVILAKLDTVGNIAWQKGYPLYNPRIKVFSDGSLLLLANLHFDDSGAVFPKSIIAKTDQQGNIDGCETELTCLRQDELPVWSAELVNTVRRGAPELLPVEVEMRDVQIAEQPFCDIPPPPSPLFELPDTLCVGACSSLDSLSNRFAHGVDWSITGPNIDTLWSGSLDFDFCFDQPGRYTIEQTVWYLGCAYTHDQVVTVLDHLEVEIDAPAGFVCESPPLTVGTISNRPLTGWFWDNGATSEGLNIVQSGNYGLTVSDGYCTATDTVQVRFAQDSIDIQKVLTLPEDTTVCEQLLPYELRPISPYVDSFSLNAVQGAVFSLNNEGSYAVAVEVLDCIYEREFELNVSDCQVSMYIPTAFSPNDDGVNDYFFPSGKDFEILELSIYDRWGGKVYHDKGAQSRWDGKSGGQLMSEGVYVFQIIFQNLLLTKREETWGEILLIK